MMALSIHIDRNLRIQTTGSPREQHTVLSLAMTHGCNVLTNDRIFRTTVLYANCCCRSFQRTQLGRGVSVGWAMDITGWMMIINPGVREMTRSAG